MIIFNSLLCVWKFGINLKKVSVFNILLYLKLPINRQLPINIHVQYVKNMLNAHEQSFSFVSSRSSSVSLPSINGQLGSDNSQSPSSSKRPNSDGKRKTTNSKQKVQQMNIWAWFSFVLEGNKIAQVNQPLCAKVPASWDAVLSEILKIWKMSRWNTVSNSVHYYF